MDVELGGRHFHDITWLRPDGGEMTEEEWGLGWVRCFAMQLSGKTLDHVNALGQRVEDDTFLVMFNPHWEPIDFFMPGIDGDVRWKLLFDTRVTHVAADGLLFQSGTPYQLLERSLALFIEVPLIE
jgi:glycogen operon protein